MKELIENRRQNLIKMGKIKNDVASSTDRIRKILIPITNTMRDIERDMVSKFNSSRISCGEPLYPVRTLFDIDRISVSGNLIKIKVSDYHCGSLDRYTIKVPLKYLDMSYGELVLSHTEWVEREFERRVNIYKGLKRNKKIKKILN